MFCGPRSRVSRGREPTTRPGTRTTPEWDTSTPDSQRPPCTDTLTVSPRPPGRLVTHPTLRRHGHDRTHLHVPSAVPSSSSCVPSADPSSSSRPSKTGDRPSFRPRRYRTRGTDGQSFGCLCSPASVDRGSVHDVSLSSPEGSPTRPRRRARRVALRRHNGDRSYWIDSSADRPRTLHGRGGGRGTV